MSHIQRHPAPGFGDLMPGWYSVPQNPIRDAGTALVPSANSMGQVTRVPRMGELMAASFTVPQNPLMAALSTVGRDQSLSGLRGCAGCGGGGVNPYGMQGLGDFSTWASATSPVGSLPNWAFFGGLAALGGYFFFGRGGRGHSRTRYSAPAAAPAAAPVATAANRRRNRR